MPSSLSADRTRRPHEFNHLVEVEQREKLRRQIGLDLNPAGGGGPAGTLPPARGPARLPMLTLVLGHLKFLLSRDS
jgi:hypothetical protein